MAKDDNVHWEDEPADDAPTPSDGEGGEHTECLDLSDDVAGSINPGADPEAEVVDELTSLQNKVAELEASLLRAAADYQNAVRRSQQNVVNAREHTIMDMSKDLLTVMDHFDHAVHFDAEASDSKALIDGVLMVRDELGRALERFGVTRIQVSRGDEFDPNCHEAMMKQPADDLESNQIVEQLQPGYMLNDKAIRPAKVSVAE